MHHYLYLFGFYSTVKKRIGAQFCNYKISELLSFLLIIFICFNFNSAKAQNKVCGTPGLDGSQNVVAAVNTYFPPSTTLTSGSKSITLQAVPPDDVNNHLSYGVTPIKSGDLILIIQMQDATFSSTQNSSYGSGLPDSGPDGLGGTGYTSIENSGKFEYVVATSDVGLTGGVLTFKGGGAGQGCVNTYKNEDFTSTAGQKRFQIVRVPQYSTLALTSNLTPPPYNGSVGGIIAFDVAGTMKFNGYKIDASERGFRGGYGPKGDSGTNTSVIYAVTSTSSRSVGKGEGIAGTPRFIWDGFKPVDNVVEGLPGGSYGRGAPANAGGGGNDHNSGGGGGANGGFGGQGGMGWQGAGGSLDPLNAGGRPGYKLPEDLSRLIMGGGGGGGDANDAISGVKGGVGGGIILINVEKIDGFGVIMSNGGNGQAGAFGSDPDGAGGGGAGGTIFVRSLTSSPDAVLTLEAKGGKGGNTENDTGGVTPHGPGGGGGGGFIYLQVSSASITSNVKKGEAGKSNSGLGTNHGATAGTDGVVKTFSTTDLPPYLQGGGSICYPNLDVSLTEVNAGPAGIRSSGTTATYKLRVSNIGGGNAGDVRIDFKLPYGFSFANVNEEFHGNAAKSSALSPTVGAIGIMNFGSYNITPGDFVELTISVKIANDVPTGIYHASAQATYLDPTRTTPDRRITALTNHFTGSNTSYEADVTNNVLGANYNGNLVASTMEDVYINAPAVVGECSAVVDGGFESAAVGEYDTPNYTGTWQVAENTDKVKIVNQESLKGALIRNNGNDKFSLQQTLAYISPSSKYTLTFNYRNWAGGGCDINATSKLMVRILDAADNSVLAISTIFDSDISPAVGALDFSTASTTNAILLQVYDPGSPNPSCGAFVDDFNITSPLSIFLSQEDVKCFGGTDGTLSITSLGGAAGPYHISYSADGGVNYSTPVNTGLITNANPFVINNLKAGAYVLKIGDKNDCLNTRNFTISEPLKLNLTGTNTAIKCKGGFSEVTLNSSEGTFPYQYSMNGSDYQSQNTFTDLIKGDYTFYVKDANDCVAQTSIQIVEPSEIKVSADVSEIPCYGGKAEVKLMATGGTGSFEYSLDGLVFQDSNTFTDVLPGTRDFTVRDENQCTQILSVVIVEPTELKLTSTNTEIKCNGGFSEVTLTATGGTGSYQYSMDGTNFQSANIFSNLPAGNYNFIVKDINNCSATITVNITQPALPISISEMHVNNICYSGSNGKIDVEVIGGTLPYQYQWSNGATTQNIANLLSDTYNLTVTDKNGCSQTLSTQILPLEPFVVIEQTEQIKCFGENSGKIDLQLAGGEAPYQISWSNGATESNLQNLAPGDYTYSAIDVFGCTQSKTITITQPQPLSARAEIKNTTCKYSTDGAITLSVSGGTKPYHSIWNSIDSGQDSSLMNISAGKYAITIIDANNCSLQLLAEVLSGNCALIANDDKFSLPRNNQISQTVATNDSDADGNPLKFNKLTDPTDGTLTFNLDGTFIYRPNADFKGIDQFTYQVCDPFGECDNATVTLVVQPMVTVNLVPKEGAIKEGDTIKITAILTESLVEDVTVYLDYSGTAQQNSDYILMDEHVSLLIPANQTVTTQYFKINAILDDIRDDNEIVFSAVKSTSEPNFVNIGNNSRIIIKDVYPETVKTTPDENSDINPDPLISPNGDGLGNESFIIYNISKYPANEVVIFNRWGNEVYRTKRYDNKDNSFKGISKTGMLTNSNKELVDGVYYYIIYTEENDKKKINKGYLILKR